MSLVSEALKKAQREAARREGRDKGLPEPLVAGAQPWRARRGSRVPLGVALATGLLALVAGLLYFSFGSGDEKPRDGRRPEKGLAKVVAPEVVPAATDPAAAVELPPPPASSSETVTPPLARTADPVIEGPAPVAAPAADPTPPAPAAAPAQGESPPPAPAPRESTFVRSARLASGAEVRLGGIAWSETAPLAYLNGKLLGVGESTAGARVDRIARDRVVLAAPEGRIVITLR